MDILTDFDAFMRGLAQHRPVFHSEADFQLALAWRLQAELPHAEVRLETRPRPGIHLDLLNDEQFDLLPQGAQDIRAYDCVKDVERVEQFVSTVPDGAGIVLVLTNDPTYWRAASHGRQTNADAFRLREGSTLTESRAWGPNTGAGTMRGREKALALLGTYTCQWQDYSSIGGKNGRFRYLPLVVKPTLRATPSDGAGAGQPDALLTPS